MKKQGQHLIFSPTDLVRYVASPFASWMERYHLENPKAITPDEETEDKKLIAKTGDDHEAAELVKFKTSFPNLVEIAKNDSSAAQQTLSAIQSGAPLIYQGCLRLNQFAGFSDFIIRDSSGHYQVWDTKLAVSPKPYYAIQLCCYSEMLAALAGSEMPRKFGIILGDGKRVEFLVQDFFDYYLRVKANFLALHEGFTGDLKDRPEPIPRADHGRWTSHAQKYFDDSDHLVNVANITVGQIKKLAVAGIGTMAKLSQSSAVTIPKFAKESLEKLVAQARLQCQTRNLRERNPDCPPAFEVLPHKGANGEALGLAALPSSHQADLFFDMEGYPLTPGGLEYLFGASNGVGDFAFEFADWWGHDREGEKTAFEGFIDWAYKRWLESPGMHIYHYAAYEISAVRRLSTRHNTRQDEVDQLLRNNVFVDLYQTVRHGLRIGAESYSIKVVERLYRSKRATEVATAVDSIVQYARWSASQEGRTWDTSKILKGIRDYNEDDCKSTAELLNWLRMIASERGIIGSVGGKISAIVPPPTLNPDVENRLRIAAELKKKGTQNALILADLIDFHRREAKPMWWRMFDRALATPEELRDDPGCIEGVVADGSPVQEKKSLVQTYRFDPAQECKIMVSDRSRVMFSYNLDAKFNLTSLDNVNGKLTLKMSVASLKEKFAGAFPQTGSLLEDESVPPGEIPDALAAVAAQELTDTLHAPAAALLGRTAPAEVLQSKGENPTDAAIRVTRTMKGACLVVQGPPGTGKTYTASRVIARLLAGGKAVGVASNSHKAINNLLFACGDAAREIGNTLQGIKVKGDSEGPLFDANPGLRYVEDNPDGRVAFKGGIVGGTAWLFSRSEWIGSLDYLFIDEAGQVSLANAVAMSRCALNLVMLGDQMQLEQPIQGTHPGDSGLSSLQYALKDPKASKEDAPAFHAVVPRDYGLFLGESRRMHPTVCQFISDSIYESRLNAYKDCAVQKIACPANVNPSIRNESGILFRGVEHDGNIQRSDEEVLEVKRIFEDLRGRIYTAKDGKERPLALEDFLFIAPYNAQVRALKDALPTDARVGSVDKFQGQEAPVCILSLCSSFGEYGSRGLAFILDRNRINVAISRAQCLAIVVADPRIATNEAKSIEEMTLTNLFCKLVRVGAEPIGLS